jgi:hypothetical protein
MLQAPDSAPVKLSGLAEQVELSRSQTHVVLQRLEGVGLVRSMGVGPTAVAGVAGADHSRYCSRVDLPLSVEFLCAAGPDRSPGRLFRPGGVVGGTLSALVPSAGRLIDVDAREVELVVELPGNGGVPRQRVRVAGPAGYLAAKADALRRRTKDEDAYDVVWIVESWPGGQRALAHEIRAAKIFAGPEFVSALRALAEEFATIDSAGAVKYARFMSEDAACRDRLARRAVGAMAESLRELSLATGDHRTL